MYAKKAAHMFTPELEGIKKIRTVSIKILPTKVCPTSVEILCSVRVIEIVKTEVENLVGMIHKLYEKEFSVQNDKNQLSRLKDLIQEQNSANEVFCWYDEGRHKVFVYGRNQLVVRQVASSLQDGCLRAVRNGDVPLDCVIFYLYTFY